MSQLCQSTESMDISEQAILIDQSIQTIDTLKKDSIVQCFLLSTDAIPISICMTKSSDEYLRISSNEDNNSRNNSILDRFCSDIVPRIQHNIECLTLDAFSTDRVVRIGNYSKLHKITLRNV
ncbi:unnamed protein product [Rotaria sp. Silwood2]|nr:unnamed protein product [Rotaria sp. Silwood2]CAF4438684.1 unnamed protein product [Rotaria sp. Silwood2]